MAFRSIIEFIFQDIGAEASLGKINARIREFQRSSPGARRGFGLLEVGMRSLALQAAGLRGPLGQVTASFASMTGGSALVLGAAAGLGLVALAVKKVGDQAKAATKDQDDFLASLARIGPTAAVTAKEAEISAKQVEIAQARDAAHRAAAARRRPEGQFGTGVLPGATETAEIVMLESQLATLRNELATLKGPAGKAEDRQRDEIRQAKLDRITDNLTAAFDATRAATRLRLDLVGRDPLTGFPRFGAAPSADVSFARGGLGDSRSLQLSVESRHAEEELTQARQFALQVLRETRTPQQVFADQMDVIRLALREGAISAEDFAQAEKHLAEERDKALKKHAGPNRLPGQLASGGAFAASLIGAVRGRGGIGELLGAGGAFAATLPGLQVPGAVLGVAGMLLSALDRSADRRNDKLIQAFREALRPLAFPELVTVVTNADIPSVRYQALRDERRDAEARFPVRR